MKGREWVWLGGWNQRTKLTWLNIDTDMSKFEFRFYKINGPGQFYFKIFDRIGTSIL